MNCLKNNIKIYIKTAPTCFGVVKPSSGNALSVLAKVTVVNIANYVILMCDQFGGDVAAYIGSVLVGVCMLHCLEKIYSHIVSTKIYMFKHYTFLKFPVRKGNSKCFSGKNYLRVPSILGKLCTKSA